MCQAGRRRRGRRQQRGRTSVRGRRARRRHGLREGVDGLFNDWRRLKRARTELIGVSETVPTSAPSQAAGRRRALPLALVISASEVTRRRPASSSSVNLPLSLPQSPHSLRVSVLDAGRSRADFLFVVRVALIGRDRPSISLYFSPTSSRPRARRSAPYDVSPLDGPPPSSPPTPFHHCWPPEHIRKAAICLSVHV